MKNKILITSRPPLECILPWMDQVDFVYPSAEKKKWTDAEVLEQIGDYDGLFLAMNHCRKDIIDAGKKLKVVGNIGVGYDNIDWEYATKKRIAVVNAPNTVTEATAELTLALIFTSMRSIFHYDKGLRKEGRCIKKAYDGPATYIYGKTLGLIGFGRIGKCLAKRAVALGLKVVYYDVFRAKSETEAEYHVTYMSFDEVLANIDIISVHVPYTEDTYHMMGEREFAKMKAGAYFINAARGKIMDEKALIAALKSGHLKGAGLDVHENEPQVSQEMIALDNVVLTPHIGTMVPEVRVNITRETLGGMIGVLNGEVPYNVVNPQIFQKRV